MATMHIDPFSAPAPAPAPACAPAPAGAAPSAAAAPSPSTTTHLRATGGDFDAARVAQLREAIASGRYAVDLGRVADGLIRHLDDLSGRRA